MSRNLTIKQFKEIDLNDSFFDSLKQDYPGFDAWFQKKQNESAYIHTNDFQVLDGFLFLKYEDGPITDVSPHISCDKALKIGTFKIDPHGTRLGERFIKKALDYAIVGNVDLCYVTIFARHQVLIKLFEKYGFIQKAKKNGELVLVKDLHKITNDILLDYPLINTSNKQKFLLAIYPEYHSIMFPDSILKNESIDILGDVTITNSIHKTYVTTMRVGRANPGDIIVMYRTKSENVSAEFSAVATSICVVEEVRSQDEFQDFEEFFNYATTYSVFDRNDLKYWYDLGKCYAMKMTYNAALSKRLIRRKLADDIGLSRNVRWSFISLTDDQFNRIIKEGGVNESIIINKAGVRK